jgi:GMP synthase-like glutamine amidotransferase
LNSGSAAGQQRVKPVAIFQHEPDAPPAYFATWLAENHIRFETIRIDRGTAVPRAADSFSGLCFMGGAMSVNDPLPWIEDELALIRDADARGVPVIGHCLGGQLLAKALGGSVRRNAVKEIGWHPVAVADAVLAREWLGEEPQAQFEFFQWHGDTFDLPAGARGFLSSTLCTNQAFVIERASFAHLGMQFHCEMTPELVADWARTGGAEMQAELAATGGPGVQSAAQMVASAETRAAQMHRRSQRLYRRWSEGLVR